VWLAGSMRQPEATPQCSMPRPTMIRLQPLGPDLARCIARGEPHDEIEPEALSEMVRNVAAAHHRLYEKTGACPPWIAYLAREDARGAAAFVGVCSFKSGPQDGAVEIAYFTFPEHEGRGVGAQMAAALVEIARREPSWRELVAHTQPQANSSTRILERLGFARAGTIEDPEDGPVWRWRLARDTPHLT
jgi:[ribosomal protein S5]-alanine N-acetyltransferase